MLLISICLTNYDFPLSILFQTFFLLYRYSVRDSGSWYLTFTLFNLPVFCLFFIFFVMSFNRSLWSIRGSGPTPQNIRGAHHTGEWENAPKYAQRRGGGRCNRDRALDSGIILMRLIKLANLVQHNSRERSRQQSESQILHIGARTAVRNESGWDEAVRLSLLSAYPSSGSASWGKEGVITLRYWQEGCGSGGIILFTVNTFAVCCVGQ
jgi:hypothetical protein